MESRIIRVLALFFILGACSISARTVFAVDQPKTLVRVAVLKDAQEFKVAIKGRFRILDPVTGAVLLEARSLREAKVNGNDKGIGIGEQNYPFLCIKLSPQNDATLYMNNRRLRGEIDILKGSAGLLTVVNILDLENYIKGVLYHEVSHYWPMEAIKAQAVAARTYALYQMKMNKGKDYDVTSDIYSQVYGGRTSERFRTNIAVDRTRGLILVYAGNILPAYYSATCGGFTEDANELWKEDRTPLRGVKCDYCLTSPHYYWKRNFRLKDIQDALNKNGYSLGLIKEIRVTERNKSGRIRTLEITTHDDQKITISGKDFRNIVGPNLIRSNNYDIVMQGYFVDFVGKGWGHGVGLCQWGASEMSRRGFSFDQILKYYYPGVEIIRYETTGF